MRRVVPALLAMILLSATACTPGGSTSPSQTTSSQPGRTKALTIGISNAVDAFSIMGSSTTSGGWQSLNELHSDGLVTADRLIQRPIPRLAALVPSFDAGTISMLPDGRMRSVYALRHDVTWQDGAPFTAQDMTFAYEVNSDSKLPFLNRDAIQEMQSVEAPDDFTFAINWRGPYYQADSMGVRALWPLPRHILETTYRTGDPQAIVNLPYWTTEYIHLGPFAVETFSPSADLHFRAYDGYFLGRPKIDRVVVRVFNDEPTLYAAALSGAVDMLMDNSLSPDLGLQLKETWDKSGEGTVHVGTGTTRFLTPQFDPAFQQQPAVLDPRVRRALMHALDRPAISDVVQRGHRELVASSLLPPGDRMFGPVKDGFSVYTFEPARARSALSELGWNPGPDSVLVGPQGNRFTTQVWTTEGAEAEIAIIADYWKQIGVIAEQSIIAGAIVRDRQARSNYPGFETSARGSGDSILSRVDSRVSASPVNNYSGANRGHYLNPRMDQLIDRYRQSVREEDQAAAIQAISDALVEDLPLMLLYFNPTVPAVRKGVKALDDFGGGAEASRLFGTLSRNSREWDLDG